MRLPDAAAATFLPEATDPVIETNRTRGWLDDARADRIAVAGHDVDHARGKMSAAISASRSVVSGVISDGFRTTVLPAARAGAIFHDAIISG